MAFTELQGINPEIRQRRRDVIEQSQAAGIDAAALPPITGVYKWEQLVRAAQSNDGTGPTLMHYLKTMGYLPEAAPRIAGANGLDPESVSGVRAKLVRDLISGAINESIFTRSPQESLRALTARYPELSKSQAQILRAIVSQEIRLEQLDVSHLERQFSFPVTQYNYFGRFLAGGDETPQRAARHLQIANPFLIRVRSLLEGLSNNRLNFLHLNISGGAERQSGNSGHPSLVGPDERRKRVESYRSTVEILHAVINSSPDFYGAHRPNGNDPLVCIPVPKIPDVNAHHIDKRKNGELAVALFEWLLYGKRDHPLLHSKTLPTNKESLCRQYNKQLGEKRDVLKSLEERASGSHITTRERKRLSRDVKRLEASIDRLDAKLDDLNRERSLITPIIRQLEEVPMMTSSIRQFRVQVAQAEASGAKVVFSLLGSSPSDRQGSLLDFLDHATNAPRSLSKSKAVTLLNNCSLLLNDETLGRVRAGRVQGPKSVIDRQVRKFTIDTDEINTSAKYVVSGILPRKEDPKLSLLIDAITTYAPPPGVQTDRELTALVQKATGKHNLQANDYLEYTFE